ncbi:hypothetical protein CLU79DRAFT_838208 [Phycomyces nitens]|nr:hypothetical protein CLU79DRAFT_838208 [Phycomyces nitens]
MVDAVSFRNESVLCVGKNGKVYHIKFSPNYQVETEKDDTIAIAALQKNNYLIIAEMDSSSSDQDPSDPHNLREAIRETLKQLSDCEDLSKKLDEEHQNVNEKLKEINATLFSLQGIKQRKETSERFECEVKPILISRPVKEMVFSDIGLRIRLKVPLSMSWKNWQLHINLNDQRPLSQEMISVERGIQESVQGKTLSTSLLGLDKLREWEHDILIPTKSLSFPLEVTTSLSYSSMNQFLPAEQRTEASPSNNDDLHFAVPCSSRMVSSIESFGLWSVTERLQPVYDSYCLLSKSGEFLAARLDAYCLLSNDIKDATKKQNLKIPEDNTEIHFKVISNDTEDSDIAYRKILYCLLQEGRNEMTMKEILYGAEKAVFTLAQYPSFPVEIVLSKNPAHTDNNNLGVILKIKCHSSYVLFKVEAALLARISNHLVDPANAPPNKESQEEAANLAKLHRLLLASYAKLESEYQASSSDKDIWDDLLATLHNMREIRNANPICWVSF